MKEGHRNRLRERFLKGGLDGFHDYEIVELMLTLATPRKDCKGIAKECIKKFKDLKGVINASKEELMKIKGIGRKNIFGIKFASELLNRFLKQKIEKKIYIKSSLDVLNYLKYSMSGLKRETFKVMFLDSKNKILDTEELFAGTVTSSMVSVREIIKRALEKNAVGIITIHNHPSGDPFPSKEDKELTKKLLFATKVMEIRLLDHIIVGENDFFSFSDKKLLDSYHMEYQSLKYHLF